MAFFNQNRTQGTVAERYNPKDVRYISEGEDAKMRQKIILFTIIFYFLVSCTIVFAQWQAVAPGIDYQEFNLTSPNNNVYVTRMNRANENCIIDSCIAQGKLSSGLETVSGMANRYDDTFGYWGEEWGKYRYDIVAAINGSGFNGAPHGGQIISGWYAKRFGEFDGSGPVWQLDRDIWLGSCVRHRSEKNRIIYPATGNDQGITGINEARAESNDLIIYTHHYDKQTPYVTDGVEVLVEMIRPTMILPPPAYAKGYVREIRQNQGSTPIPFDHIVLSAEGPSADQTLLNNVSIGSEVRVSQEITHYLDDCNTPNPLDWSKTYCSVRYMTFTFLKDGVVDGYPGDYQANQYRARTAVAYNDDYIYFVVVDEIAGSSGMTMQLLGNFCLNYLGATHGINQDGGGSSTLWVNGEVKNNPTWGQRSVANGLMMVSLQPKLQSSSFATSETVKTVTSSSVRLGPGTNYSALITLPAEQEGLVIEHSLNGIYAQGKYWWKCKFDSTEGWIAEENLESTMSARKWQRYF